MVHTIEKALFIAICMYALSFSLLIGQYIFMDIMGLQMYSPVTGTPVQPAIIQMIHTGTINSINSDVVNVNATTSNVFTGIERAFQLGMTVGLDLFTLMTGTYIFSLLEVVLGLPRLVTLIFVAVYVFLLIRAAMSYFRNG